MTLVDHLGFSSPIPSVPRLRPYDTTSAEAQVKGMCLTPQAEYKLLSARLGTVSSTAVLWKIGIPQAVSRTIKWADRRKSH